MLVLGSTYVHIGWDKVDSFNAIQWQMKVPINKDLPPNFNQLGSTLD